MAETEAEEAQARRKRIRTLKKLIIIVPLTTILILLALCIFLGIRLYMVEKELRTLRVENEKTAVMKEIEDTSGSTQEIAAGDMENIGESVDASKSASDTDGIVEAKPEETDRPEKGEDMREVYLTFDDGPSGNTGRILDILAEYDVKATFFVVGKENEEYQPLYNRIVEEGHTLAMHSYSHKYKEIYQSEDAFIADTVRLQDFLYQTTGVMCRFYRFPGGSSNTVSDVDMHDLITCLDEQGISYFDWNLSSGDAASTYISPEDIVRNCTEKLENYHEAIILMHDATDKNSTVEALPQIIDTIQAMDKTRIVPITESTEPIQHISND